MYLLTGGSGLLGKELLKIMEENGVQHIAPKSSEVDITRKRQVRKIFTGVPLRHDQITHIIHCAAATGVAKGEEKNAKERFYLTNVIGTRNVLELATLFSCPITYISTDYVFDGEKDSPYKIKDIPNPLSYYAMTKLIGEEIVRTYKRSQVIRTSFKSSKWKDKGAFVDQITSADYVDVIAKLIWKVVDSEEFGVFHVGTKPKTTYSLAKKRNPEVEKISVNDIAVKIPRDVSLELSEL